MPEDGLAGSGCESQAREDCLLNDTIDGLREVNERLQNQAVRLKRIAVRTFGAPPPGPEGGRGEGGTIEKASNDGLAGRVRISMGATALLLEQIDAEIARLEKV